MKKFLSRFGLAAGTLAIIAAGAAGFAAFEAHVVNVTATIENATDISTSALTFGDVFPQEVLHSPITLSLSDSFKSENNTNAVDVDYIIKQKPKCGLPIPSESTSTPTAYSAFGLVTEDANGKFSCADPGYVELPLLCPYLSKTSPQEGDTSVPAFHGPITLTDWTDQVSTQTEAIGHLSKTSSSTEATTWDIDLHTPCFKGECAQDWTSFVEGANPAITTAAEAASYEADPSLQHQEFGCDLWYELYSIGNSSSSTPPGTGPTSTGISTLTVTKVVVGTSTPASAFPLFVDSSSVTSGVATTTSAGAHVVSESGGPAGYSEEISGDCAGNGDVTIPAGGSASCTITNTFETFKVGALLSAYTAPSGGSCNVNVPSTGITTITQGIATATPGQTVCVAAGTYNENVNVNKSITLAGAGTTTIVNGQTAGFGGAVTITADNVKLEGFAINGAGGSQNTAVYISGKRTGDTVQYNTITTGPSGSNAFLTDGGQTNHTISNNVFKGIAAQLVYVNGFADVGATSTNVDFTSNTFSGSATGPLLGNDADNSTNTMNKFTGAFGGAAFGTFSNTESITQNNFDEDSGTEVAGPATGPNIDATKNWWGNTSPAGNVSGNVTFTPFEFGPYPENP